jgi:hypothetical protein
MWPGENHSADTVGEHATMKRLILATALISGMIALSSSYAAAAPPKYSAPPIVSKPAKMSPTNLSEGDCTDLGGKVSSESFGICNSGKLCLTVDENNKKHIVCISKM